MNIDEIKWHNIELVPERVRASKQEKIQNVVSVGEAFIANAVTYTETAGQELDPTVLILKDKYDFSYCRLPINIRPRDRYNLRFLAVDVLLESENREAVCWSIEPMHVEEQIKLKTEAKISAGLKLAPVEVGPTLGQSKEYVHYQPFIEAFGLGQADPGWEFKPTKGRKLSGIQILHMVVKVPKNTMATGIVSIKADIYTRGLLWNFRAQTRDEDSRVLEISFPGF